MSRYFRSQPVFNTAVDTIDRENGIIRGITVARTGPARGHEGLLDKTFLLQVVELANTRPQGIKARFGHPNMCSTALGTYLGRFHDYAYHADRVTATLKLDKTAKTSPKGNFFDYVLDMAQNNPDMFGASLVFESDKLHTEELNVDGKQTKKHFFRLKELRATDIVDDPAASDGLFSTNSRWLSEAEARWLSEAEARWLSAFTERPGLSGVEASRSEAEARWLSAFTERPGLSGVEASRSGAEARWLSAFTERSRSGAEAPAFATQLLDENPDLAKFIFSKPESIIEFLHNYLNNNNMNLSESITSNFRRIFSLGNQLDLPEVQTSPDNPKTDQAEATQPAVPDPDKEPAAEPSESEPPKVVEPQLDTIPDPLTVAFDHFLKVYPTDDIFQTDEGYFFKEDNSKINQHGMLAFMLATVSSLKDELAKAGETILELNQKLSARPTKPAKVSDPLVTVSTETAPVDDTGKQILQALPHDLRFKLRKPKQTNA